ncbi:MAG: hypothetical protein GX868_18535, partial [Actinobacteria bacterium]|nr:hypothetical protein [Actinomycetota bacterium]
YGVDPAGAVIRLTAGAEVVGLDGAVVVAVPQEAVADVLEARLAATLALAVRNR